MPIYNNEDQLYKVLRAVEDGTATRIGLPKDGYQLVEFQNEQHLVRDIASYDDIYKDDLDVLKKHEKSHTIGRHGPDVTPEQLFLRSETGIAPDGSFNKDPPSFSSRFGSIEQMVIAKDDVLEEIANGNISVNPLTGLGEVKIRSTDVYGDGIKAGDPITELEDVTGLTASLQQVNGEWQIITMHPGVI